MKTWRERIAEARERGQFTMEDVRLALGWNTCAVGEQHAVRGVSVELIAKDRLVEDGLYELGAQFYGAVRTGRIDKAEHLLDQIEDRVLELKREAAS